MGNDSPTVLYTYFPFSGIFGSVFWGGVVGEKYPKLVDFHYHGSDNKQHLPVQYNAGFTSRILPAYLANNSDQYGFVLQPSVSSTEVLVPRNFDRSDNVVEGGIIENLPFSVTRARVDNRVSLEAKFGSMGIPVLLDSGKHDLKFTQRISMAVSWINPQDLEQKTRQYLHLAETAKVASSIPVQVIESVSETMPLEKSVVYVAPISLVEKLYKFGLKTIGYLDQENAYLVLRKY